MYGIPAPATEKRPPEARQDRGRQRRHRVREVGHVHEVRAGRADPVEVLEDLLPGDGQGVAPESVELLGEEDVLRDLHARS